MRVPILKNGDFLVATVQSDVSDTDLLALRHDLLEQVGLFRARGVIIDVTAVDVLDSFACRVFRGIAQAAKLRGAETVLVGIQPEVALAMVQLGLRLDGIETALDLDEGLAVLARLADRGSGHGF